MSAVTAVRNARWERIEWVVDITIYAFLAGCGLSAILAPSDFLRDHIRSEPTLWLWGVLLLVGGVAGALARIVSRWWIEQLGNVAATAGAVIYLGVVTVGTLSGPPGAFSLVFVFLLLVAIAACFRRYAGLQQDTYVPTLDTWRAQFLYLIRRRTPLVPPRAHRR